MSSSGIKVVYEIANRNIVVPMLEYVPTAMFLCQGMADGEIGGRKFDVAVNVNGSCVIVKIGGRQLVIETGTLVRACDTALYGGESAKPDSDVNGDLLDALLTALPFVEEAVDCKAYKAGAVSSVIAKIKNAITASGGK